MGVPIADQDGDGEDIDTISGGTDCNDKDETIGPRLKFGMMVDQDCSGGSDYDQHGDGEDTQTAAWAQIVMTQTQRLVLRRRHPYNGIDEDCADGDLTDVDGMGLTAPREPTGR